MSTTLSQAITVAPKVGYGGATYVGHPIRVPALDGVVFNVFGTAKNFLLGNNVAEAKQLSVFLTIIGKKTFALLRDLLAPTRPQDLSLDYVIAALQKHFEPKPLMTAECFHFGKEWSLIAGLGLAQVPEAQLAPDLSCGPKEHRRAHTLARALSGPVQGRNRDCQCSQGQVTRSSRSSAKILQASPSAVHYKRCHRCSFGPAGS